LHQSNDGVDLATIETCEELLNVKKVSIIERSILALKQMLGYHSRWHRQL
jgi:methionine synthase I (cobalamin-dependent)